MNQTFKELAEKDASMEKSGELSAATSCWRKAGAYSDNQLNRDWCAARAEFCDNHLWRGV